MRICGKYASKSRLPRVPTIDTSSSCMFLNGERIGGFFDVWCDLYAYLAKSTGGECILRCIHAYITRSIEGSRDERIHGFLIYVQIVCISANIRGSVHSPVHKYMHNYTTTRETRVSARIVRFDCRIALKCDKHLYFRQRCVNHAFLARIVYILLQIHVVM